MKEFKLSKDFKGYLAKRDITTLSGRHLIAPSQNVFINDQDKVVTRKGYTLDGEASTTIAGIESAKVWQTSTGREWALRAHQDLLEYRHKDADGNVSWKTLMGGLASVRFRFTTFWSTDEYIDLLLFVNGESKIFEWSGAITTFKSATWDNQTSKGTITKEGNTLWGEERFLTKGTRKVIIDGTEYTYTGGEGTTTLTGVTPNPTTAGHQQGATVIQAVRENANTSITYLPDTFKNDLIEILNNQIYVGSETSREVYVSKTGDFLDYSFSAPRKPSEGALLTLDSTPKGFAPQEDAMYISSGKDDWYQTVFTLSSDFLKERLTVTKLKTSPQQSAQSQELITKIKNVVAFVSFEPMLDQLGRIENITTPQTKPLSDPIKDDFMGYDFTDGAVAYYSNQIHVVLPKENKWLIYDIVNGRWQPPQVMGFSRLSVIEGELYAHSASVPETYKLFEGYNDNGNPFLSIAAFGYESFDRRDWQKSFDEYLTEGYIRSNTTVDVTFLYELYGSGGKHSYQIKGSDKDIIFKPSEDTSLGKNPLGQMPLGTSLKKEEKLPKFRQVNTTVKCDFYEFAVVYKTYSPDGRFAILAHGPNVLLSKADNLGIKK